MRSNTPFHKTPRHAFTLIELIVVVGIMILVMAFVVPSMGPLMRSSNMNKATAMITDELNYARQQALTQNRDVEVRFYQLPSKSNSTDIQYRAFRSFSMIGSGTTQAALSPIKYLPEPVVISTASDSSGNTLSTLLSGTNVGSGLTQNTVGETLTTGAQAPYISFLFRAPGGTSLAISNNWYLTIYLENAPKNATTGFPANYFTAQVDAVTGRVRSYRP
ncbi:MAG: Verru_Chthon cassette protein D [Chthoniobacteraceae bacterium]